MVAGGFLPFGVEKRELDGQAGEGVVACRARLRETGGGRWPPRGRKAIVLLACELPPLLLLAAAVSASAYASDAVVAVAATATAATCCRRSTPCIPWWKGEAQTSPPAALGRGGSKQRGSLTTVRLYSV
ncbi:uncharacterized protein K452DRAFT_283540 [Aplosporella prunicola CBS 121167]|uniref:Uncharacterized protein n=1 Tax=Aplosporella prunicola CBS 121167 TaxID=1176127 RepID=A0A6A6BSK3_9PEZI|nr:uncharacterized protein K452DRAFT_283540 [Aplosporella prunicola CBS 121167]KAF2146265.1 hypothetical protein K452DRAFT_283540 [Aplosporella prunicola CBS 121167]